MMWALNSHDLEIHSLYPIPIQMCPSGFQISGQTVTVLLLHSSEYRTSSRRNVLQCGELLMLILSPRMYRYCELCLIQANWRIPSMRSLLKTQHSKKEDHGIWSHHFMQMGGETMVTVTDFIFFGSKITVDGNCSHEIKNVYSLGEKL